MKERPIIFNDAMVRAILAGTKTQTRRIVKPQPADGWAFDVPPLLGWIRSLHRFRGRYGALIHRGLGTNFPETDLIPCPFGQPRDRLWVREAWRTSKVADELKPSMLVGGGYSPIWHEARDDVPFHPSKFGRLRPSMHMPRWASRITLEITGVRVERVQDIGVVGAYAEGIPENSETRMPVYEFTRLWRSLYGDAGWIENPWVWVIEFRRVESGGAQ